MDTLRTERDPQLTRIYTRVKVLMDSGIESETNGKWYFCSHGGYQTLRFSLEGYRISIGGIWGDIKTKNDRYESGSVPTQGVKDTIEEVFYSEAAIAEAIKLAEEVFLGEGFEPGIVYEFDPLNGTKFEKGEGSQVFMD